MRVSLMLLLLYAFTGCSSSTDGRNELARMPEHDLYNAAVSHMNDGDIEAVQEFDVLIQVYPVSERVEKAYILKAYTYYSHDKFDDAIMTVDDYVEQYKHSPSLAYMKYLRAMCYYSQLVDEGRDQKMTIEAMHALHEVIEEFPDTQYAKDAKWKYEYAMSLLAGKEIMIGRFYLKNGNVVAAINRFKTVLDLYSTTIFAPEALYRMCEAYTALGIKSEATAYAAVLAENFKDSAWHRKAYIILHKNWPPVAQIRRTEGGAVRP